MMRIPRTLWMRNATKFVEKAVAAVQEAVKPDQLDKDVKTKEDAIAGASESASLEPVSTDGLRSSSSHRSWGRHRRSPCSFCVGEKRKPEQGEQEDVQTEPLKKQNSTSSQ